MDLTNKGNGHLSSPGSSIPEATGRFLVLLRHDVLDSAIQTLAQVTGRRFVKASDIAGAGNPAVSKQPANLVLDNIGVAVMTGLPTNSLDLVSAAAETNHILAVEPEKTVHAISARAKSRLASSLPSEIRASASSAASPEYSRGYHTGVNHVARINQLLGEMVAATGDQPQTALETAATFSEQSYTWGLQITNVVTSPYSGKDVRIAVLDTGLDLQHPDFAGRTITAQSFVSGETPTDVDGHGTHCTGTACGPKIPAVLPRYGIAYNSEIYVGKVLNDQGMGTDADILSAIDWAVANKCAIISMSFETPVTEGESYSTIYEQVAQRALQAGTLIIAAAGNDSHRDQGIIAPVGHPANCPSIMAVAAIDSQSQIALFSNGGINPNEGQVDIAAPGVAVHSSWPMPGEYNTLDGTSVATPHVAGIAALWAEARPGTRGFALWSVLQQQALRMALPARDVGAGLVQAPQ